MDLKITVMDEGEIKMNHEDTKARRDRKACSCKDTRAGRGRKILDE